MSFRKPIPLKVFLLVSLSLFAVATVSVWKAMPYPFSIYKASWSATKYNSNWPISKSDYNEAKRLVTTKLGFYEFISSVYPDSPSQITVMTVKKWKGTLAASGRGFTLEKQNGHWVIKESNSWIS